MAVGSAATTPSWLGSLDSPDSVWTIFALSSTSYTSIISEVHRRSLSRELVAELEPLDQKLEGLANECCNGPLISRIARCAIMPASPSISPATNTRTQTYVLPQIVS